MRILGDDIYQASLVLTVRSNWNQQGELLKDIREHGETVPNNRD